MTPLVLFFFLKCLNTFDILMLIKDLKSLYQFRNIKLFFHKMLISRGEWGRVSNFLCKDTGKRRKTFCVLRKKDFQTLKLENNFIF